MSLIQTKLKEGDEDGSFIQSSIMFCFFSYKIRFEAPKRQRERDSKDPEVNL
jgi:hypothetical protein